MTSEISGAEARDIRTHAVQFYDEDAFLIQKVSAYLVEGLKANDHLVVVATEPHRRALVQSLRGSGVDEALVQWVDAKEMLTTLMDGGSMPNEEIFRALLSSLMTGKTHVRGYGEMVDLLWKDGNSQAALRLEVLWHEAASHHPLSILCSYAMDNFYKTEDAKEFLQICRVHDHVLPSEEITSSEELAVLQLRAHLLANEVAHRKLLENQLGHVQRKRDRLEDELRESLKRERATRSLLALADERNVAISEVLNDARRTQFGKDVIELDSQTVDHWLRR